MIFFQKSKLVISDTISYFLKVQKFYKLFQNQEIVNAQLRK